MRLKLWGLEEGLEESQASFLMGCGLYTFSKSSAFLRSQDTEKVKICLVFLSEISIQYKNLYRTYCVPVTSVKIKLSFVFASL